MSELNRVTERERCTARGARETKRRSSLASGGLPGQRRRAPIRVLLPRDSVLSVWRDLWRPTATPDGRNGKVNPIAEDGLATPRPAHHQRAESTRPPAPGRWREEDAPALAAGSGFACE